MNKYNFCVYIDTFSSNIVGTLYHLKGIVFKINKKKTANDNKINNNNQFMFVINNPKGTIYDYFLKFSTKNILHLYDIFSLRKGKT